MKAKLLLVLGAVTLGCLPLADCGGSSSENGSVASSGNSAPANPLGSPSSVLDTQQVLALAEKTSETALPFSVDGGAVTVFPADDQSGEPIGVNGT